MINIQNFFGFKLRHRDYHLFFFNIEKNVHQSIKPSSFDWGSKIHSNYFLYFDFCQDKDFDKYFDLAKELLPYQNNDILLLDNFNTDDWIHYVLAFPFTDPIFHDFMPLPHGPKLPSQVPDLVRNAPDIINSGYPICIPEVQQRFPFLIWFACHMEPLIKDNYHNYTHNWYINTPKKTCNLSEMNPEDFSTDYAKIIQQTLQKDHYQFCNTDYFKGLSTLCIYFTCNLLAIYSCF